MCKGKYISFPREGAIIELEIEKGVVHMWNVKAYKRVLQEIKDSGFFNGKSISTKEEIYKELAKCLFQNYETVKSWTRPTSGGPGDENVRKELEEMLGLTAGALTSNQSEEKGKTMQDIRLTDFNKSMILRCYELMKDYLHDEDMESEDCFSHMFCEVEKLKIAIPAVVYEKICQFIDDKLAPIIYEREDTFAECYREELGFYNEEGIWEAKDEESVKKMCMAFILKTMEIEQELDAFAMEELQPLLV